MTSPKEYEKVLSLLAQRTSQRQSDDLTGWMFCTMNDNENIRELHA